MLGKCFIGSSGKLLDQIISRAKIPDIVCYFTNTVLCRPCNSKSEGNREPSQEEVFACMPNVKEVIDAAEYIQMIVLVGLIAKKYYASRFKGMPILEITHPAAILRKGGAQSSLFYDNVRKLERFWHDNNY
jgi:uracil-DNA glycosylase